MNDLKVTFLLRNEDKEVLSDTAEFIIDKFNYDVVLLKFIQYADCGIIWNELHISINSTLHAPWGLHCHWEIKDVYISTNLLDIIGFFIILPLPVELVDFTSHISLLLQVKTLKDKFRTIWKPDWREEDKIENANEIIKLGNNPPTPKKTPKKQQDDNV